VFTIEPGLYYPDRGLGVRLENTVWIRPDGAVEVVAPYPLDLVLPLRRGSAGRRPDGNRKTAHKTRTGGRSRKKKA
jgi:hypothetical protein